VKAQLGLRAMILAGDLPGGARIAELSLVDKLGVSRTPIRAALVLLEQEGLLVGLAGGGFAVKTFSERDVSEAIELRGCLEGLLARLAAERGAGAGAGASTLTQARETLLRLDALLQMPALDDDAFTAYVDLNARFHGLLMDLAGSTVIRKEAERVSALPFASPSGFVLAQATSPQARDMFIVAQDQHWQVLQAIENREGARAESLMREHSRLAQRNLIAAVTAKVPPVLPGVQLIRRRI
jgi:GntR family transcriptional regulator of vanillate catabolism